MAGEHYRTPYQVFQDGLQIEIEAEGECKVSCVNGHGLGFGVRREPWPRATRTSYWTNC
jgi:hypothetical protein